MSFKDLEWEEVHTEHIVQDEWIDFRKTAYRIPGGKIYEPFYSYTRRDYTVTVASDEEGRFLCVRQFRQGIREVTTEFPAGGIEQKDGADELEAALEAARRELREETGYESDRWQFLLKIPANATISDNYAYLFRARGCRKTGAQDLDEMEVLNIERYTAEEIEEMISRGNFQQAMHILAWMLSRREETEGKEADEDDLCGSPEGTEQ